MPCISIPHKQLIGLGFFIHELCLLVQNFIFLCHSTITTFHFSSGGKKIKSAILILLSKVHILHLILFVDRNPRAAGLTSLCLGSPHICMSYYNGTGAACAGPAGGGEAEAGGGRRGRGRRAGGPGGLPAAWRRPEPGLKAAASWRPALFWPLTALLLSGVSRPSLRPLTASCRPGPSKGAAPQTSADCCWRKAPGTRSPACPAPGTVLRAPGPTASLSLLYEEQRGT